VPTSTTSRPSTGRCRSWSPRWSAVGCEAEITCSIRACPVVTRSGPQLRHLLGPQK
jgi:hypothetical protein